MNISGSPKLSRRCHEEPLVSQISDVPREEFNPKKFIIFQKAFLRKSLPSAALTKSEVALTEVCRRRGIQQLCDFVNTEDQLSLKTLSYKEVIILRCACRKYISLYRRGEIQQFEISECLANDLRKMTGSNNIS